jgi:hypothetical protein
MAEPPITTPQTPQEAKAKSKGKNKFKPGEVGYIKTKDGVGAGGEHCTAVR